MDRKRKKWKAYSGTRRARNRKRREKQTGADVSESARVDKPDYFAYLKSPEWRAKRFERLMLDSFSCQMCGQHGGVLNIHHLTYKRLGHEKMGDLLTLCPACHEKIHEALRKQA